ncbi:MAG: adenylate/guanylate cyclase domain-containing protein [Acidimicrobiales bacterium]
MEGGRGETVRAHDQRSFGVRPLSAAEARRLGRVGALLLLVCGFSCLQIWASAGDAVDHRSGYLIAGVLTMAFGALVLALVHVATDEAIDAVFPRLAVSMMFAGSAIIPVILYLAGFDLFAIGSVVYALPLLFGFWLLTRRLAIALLIVIATGLGILLAASDGVVAPASQWLFLLTVLTATGVLVGGLVDQLDQLAHDELAARRALAEVNQSLEERVVEQVDELERLSRLRRFLSAQVADAVVSSGSEEFLAAHRREIAVFFCDLRGFTAFSGDVEPEEVVDVLNDYYDIVGSQLRKYEATVGHFAGDGIMAYLNDPNPCDRPASLAVEMALGLRDPMEDLRRDWLRHGYELGCGVSVTLGHATLGVIGFEGRNDYTPLGTVVNLAARLCDEAASGQILIDRRAHLAVADQFETRPLPDVVLKGFAAPVPVHEVLAKRGP